jgi:hypothetical protein
VKGCNELKLILTPNPVTIIKVPPFVPRTSAVSMHTRRENATLLVGVSQTGPGQNTPKYALQGLSWVSREMRGISAVELWALPVR